MLNSHRRTCYLNKCPRSWKGQLGPLANGPRSMIRIKASGCMSRCLVRANPFIDPIAFDMEDGVVRATFELGKAFEGPLGHIHGADHPARRSQPRYHLRAAKSYALSVGRRCRRAPRPIHVRVAPGPIRGTDIACTSSETPAIHRTDQA